MSMDEFMRSLSDQQKLMFMSALQDSGTPPEADGNEDDSKWTTTMPPHIKEEFEKPAASAGNDLDFSMNNKQSRKQAVRASGKNGFTDDGAECKGTELETPEYTPTKRTRRPAEKVNVSCSVCGRKITLDKKHVLGEYHRCSKCCGRG